MNDQRVNDQQATINRRTLNKGRGSILTSAIKRSVLFGCVRGCGRAQNGSSGWTPNLETREFVYSTFCVGGTNDELETVGPVCAVG
jgi:hypothetical protein